MRQFRFLPLALAGLLTACGGGGSSRALPATAPSPAPTLNASGSAHFTITVPPKTVTSAQRSPRFVSANTQSVIITLTSVAGHPFTGTLAETAANLNVSNPSCSGTPLTCTIAVAAVAGSDIFTVSTYDAVQTGTSPATPAGNLLSTASVTVTVAAGQNNAPASPLVLDGVPVALAATFATDTATIQHVTGSQAGGFSIVGSQPYTITISMQDASGATIVGSGTPTILSGNSAVTVTNVTGTTYKLQAKGYSATPVSITASTPSGTAPSFTVKTIPELWVVLDNNVGIVGYALFPGCSPVACTPIASDAITNVPFAYSIAFDPNGNLWVGDQTNGIYEFAPGTGPTPTPLATITNIAAGLVDALGMTFDSAGKLWVADGGAPALVEFTPSNGATPLRTISGSFCSPTDVAMDPSGTLWALDSCAGQVIAYNTSTGVATGASVLDNVPAQTNPTAVFLTFDPSGNLWLAGNTSAGIEKFTPPLTISSNPVATISSGVNASQGLAFDPAGNLYVANYNNSNVTAYVPTNGATPFATIGALNPIAVKVTP